VARLRIRDAAPGVAMPVSPREVKAKELSMARKPDFDLDTAHRFFAADCFNRAWDLIEKPDRSSEDDRMMVALNQASIFHWLQRPDVTARNLSIGYWQASRIQSLLGNGREARHWAEVSLDYGHELEPFYLGYAYEALARAAICEGAGVAAWQFLVKAVELAAQIVKSDDRRLLEKDLQELQALIG
jgi:hypothetical protein